MITIGQYLQPTEFHLPVERYVPPEEFESLKTIAENLGFNSVASGPMVGVVTMQIFKRKVRTLNEPAS